MEPNLQALSQQAATAGVQNVDILVFPEDGILGIHEKRDVITPYLEMIPNPKNTRWIPCDISSDFPHIEVQRRLSCMAKTNSLYVIANIGDMQPCSKYNDTKCPSDGHYIYNTNVVFGPNGALMSRYHKINLFRSEKNVFNVPNKEDNVFFETPFGRFGVITCFDILFFDPSVSLVVNNGVGNIVLPTAWMDSLPLLAAIQFHSAFAMGMGINVLAANLHIPVDRFQGSGIYTPGGAASYFYDGSASSEGKLLIKEIPVITKPLQKMTLPPSLSPKVNEDEFKSLVNSDGFNFVPLKKRSAVLRVCQNHVCCQLNYTADLKDSHDIYAFGAFDGMHKNEYYRQICLLTRCANMSRSSCGSYTYDAKSTFSQMKISGSFATPYIYPEVLMTQGGSFTLAQTELRFANKTLSLRSPLKDPLVAAALFARVYKWDDDSQVSKGTETRSRLDSYIIVILLMCFMEM